MTRAADDNADLVSVIIAAFNSEAYLDEAITSVLAQQWEPLELIVVDDGSTDGTRAVARCYGSGVKIVEGSDQGLAATRNRGMAAAHGSAFLHLDADDVLAPDAIRTLMGILKRDKACEIAAGRVSCFFSPEVSDDVALRLSVPAEPQRGHISGVAIIKAEVFGRVGGLDGNYEPASDMEWWLRAGEQGVNVQLVDDVVLRRRIHGNNSSLRNSKSHREVSLRMIREARTRKRPRIT